MTARIVVYRTRSVRRSQRWAWRLVAANGHTIAVSGEGYANRSHAVHMAVAVTRGQYTRALVDP